jgi:beta-glucanase (GH16 family)
MSDDPHTNKVLTVFLAVMAALVLLGWFASGAKASTPLVWQDGFNGPVGPPPHWTARDGTNCGAKTPTSNDPANVALDGHGHLVLTGDAGGIGVQLDTQGHFSVTHGTIEARMWVPAGDGLCSAFWMVGDNGDWPHSGEIDILELLGNLPNTAIFTLHGPTNVPWEQGNYQQYETSKALSNLTTGYHTYAVTWTTTGFAWSVDGVVYARESRTALVKANGPGSWVFGKPFHLILNLEVGNWQEGPDATTPLPAHMLVDWIKVYR